MKILYNDGHVAECPEAEELEVLRHSAAHIMAQAVKRLYPTLPTAPQRKRASITTSTWAT